MREQKYTVQALHQMQAMPLYDKIRMSVQRIKDYYEYFNGDVYISFSGFGRVLQNYEEETNTSV